VSGTPYDHLMGRLLLGLVLLGSPALAQDAPRGPAPAAPSGPNAEGDYGGVQPGQPRKPDPGKKAKKPPPKGTLSWVGFEAKEGAADVFLQAPAPFEVNQRVEGGTLVVTLSGVSKLGPNTWRPIDTRFFDTPLARITAKKKGKGIELRIVFKHAKDAVQGSVRTATEADGMYYAYLSFAGAGSTAGGNPPGDPER
jgi:hypothetical protein